MIRILAITYVIGALLMFILELWALRSITRMERSRIRNLDVARAAVDALVWPLALTRYLRRKT